MDSMKCECCDRYSAGGYLSPDSHFFCSLECACYGGRFSVRSGWINDGQLIKKTPSKSRGYELG